MGKEDMIKMDISNPIKIAERLEWVHTWNHYRGYAPIAADSLGITAEEWLSNLNGHSSDEECEFYSDKYSQL